MSELLLFLLFCAAVRFGPGLVGWVRDTHAQRRIDRLLQDASPAVREVPFPPGGPPGMSPRTDRDGTYQVTHRRFSARLIVEQDTVVFTEPRLNWLRGKPFAAAYANLVEHGCTCERRDILPPPYGPPGMVAGL